MKVEEAIANADEANDEKGLKSFYAIKADLESKLHFCSVFQEDSTTKAMIEHGIRHSRLFISSDEASVVSNILFGMYAKGFTNDGPFCRMYSSGRLTRQRIGQEDFAYNPHITGSMLLLGQEHRFSGVRGIHWLNDPNGTFLRINPLRDDGRKDDDVTAFRHVLVEFDKDSDGNPIPKELQYATLLDSKMPLAAVIDSGNKSIHGWVKVDAADISEYRERVERIYQWFADLNLDPHNRNPSRYSRMPGISRNLRNEDGNVERVSQHSLLAVNVGAPNWDDWECSQLW